MFDTLGPCWYTQICSLKSFVSLVCVFFVFCFFVLFSGGSAVVEFQIEGLALSLRSSGSILLQTT